MTFSLTAVPAEARAAGDAGFKALIEGVEITERSMLAALERHGVRKLAPEGEKFDPNFHQAMFEVPDPDVPAGTVVQVVQPGYSIGERVLRPAMVGVSRGGQAKPAAEAQGEIDVRFSTEAESREIERILSSLKPIDERTKVFVSGSINRPPMERTAAVVELFEKARAIAADLDFDLGEAQVGGASDGNFLAAMGIPVLDGLGISGDGAHAVHEHIEADDIARRGALIGSLILSV